MRRTTFSCASLTTIAGLSLLGGCTPHASDLFEPDWQKVLDREASQREFIGDLPGARPENVSGALLPDLDAAEGSIALSVEEAAVLALTRNREVQVVQLTPVVAGAFEMIERGVFDPEVFANTEFATEEVQETARSTGDQFGVRGDDRFYEVGVRQTLPTGTDVEIGATQSRSASSRAPEQQSLRVGLTVTQSLLRGFGPAVNLVGVRQAELETRASLYELRGFLEALLADAEIAYWEFVLAGREIAIFERSLQVAREQADQARQRIEVGVLSEVESAALQSEVALREQALIDARSNLEAARLTLLRRINALRPDEPSLTIEPTTIPDIDPTPIADLPERIDLALQMRPDLDEARLQFEQDRLETIRTRNGLLPRLDVFIALGKTGYSDTFEGTFHRLDEDTFDAAVGLSASQSLNNLAARGAHRAAIATRQQAAAAVQNLEQLIVLDVQLAANEVERAREQIAASATTRRLQERTADAERQRFEAGTSTTLLVAQAQRDLLQAEIAEVEAIIAYRIALIRLYLAEGSLLERRGITVGV